jgi:hypothetical protein
MIAWRRQSGSALRRSPPSSPACGWLVIVALAGVFVSSFLVAEMQNLQTTRVTARLGALIKIAKRR